MPSRIERIHDDRAVRVRPGDHDHGFDRRIEEELAVRCIDAWNTESFRRKPPEFWPKLGECHGTASGYTNEIAQMSDLTDHSRADETYSDRPTGNRHGRIGRIFR